MSAASTGPSAPLGRASRQGSGIAEREAVIAYLGGQAASVRRMAGRLVSANHRLGEDEAEQLALRIEALAAGIRAGLHLAEAG